MSELANKLKRHFRFSKGEVKGIIIACILIGFLYSFRNWGFEGVADIGHGISVFILAIFIMLVSYLLHLSIQRVMALNLGYKATFEVSEIGLAISLMVVILTNGIIAPVLPGWQSFKEIPRYRLGKWPPGYNTIPLAWTTSSGIFLSTFIALASHAINSVFPSLFWAKITIINLGIAGFALVPIIKNTGLHLLYGSKLAYVFIAIIVLVTVVFILVEVPALITGIAAVVLAIAGGAAYIYKYDDFY